MNLTPGGGHPSAELAGLDASGTVGLRLGRTNTDVQVRLERGWRGAVGPERLGAAVLETQGRLARARLAAQSSEPVPPAPAPAPRATREAVAQLGRAWQDLRDALNGLTTVTNTAITSNSALMTRFDDSTGFRNGAWPRSTALDPGSPAATSLADGSLSDGDDTDWHLL